mgnify:CR=1 FL=1|tara:strand:- start:564 stop:1196 length:633 start_codon:yes stop_codon:yes gene_type:complete
MTFTRVVGPGIHTQANIHSHNIQSTGIITAVGLDITGPVSIAGTLSYDDVTNIDSVGLITARKGIISSGVVTATAFHGASQIGIQSGGVQIGAGITQLNFVGTGNTFAVNGTTVDISIQGGGGGGSGAGFSTSNAGLHTTSSIGVNTSALASTLTGVGNSFQGIYVSNGMMIMDNTLNGNHYIGTTYNGLMAGPVNINGTLSIDGNYVVV